MTHRIHVWAWADCAEHGTPRRACCPTGISPARRRALRALRCRPRASRRRPPHSWDGVYVGYPPSPTSSWRRVLTLLAPPHPSSTTPPPPRNPHPAARSKGYLITDGTEPPGRQSAPLPPPLTGPGSERTIPAGVGVKRRCVRILSGAQL